MRSIAVAFAAGLVAAGAAYAHEALLDAPARNAGTLTCTTRPEASLVFGLQPVADCTFASRRGGAAQAYVALLSPAGADEVAAARTLSWRVVPSAGARPDGLAGRFSADPGADAAASLRGAGVDLAPLGRHAAVIALDLRRVETRLAVR